MSQRTILANFNMQSHCLHSTLDLMTCQCSVIRHLYFVPQFPRSLLLWSGHGFTFSLLHTVHTLQDILQKTSEKLLLFKSADAAQLVCWCCSTFWDDIWSYLCVYTACWITSLSSTLGHSLKDPCVHLQCFSVLILSDQTIILSV